MDISLATCFVQVVDPETALFFYRDVLGLEVRADVSRGDFRWITVGSGEQPDVGIVLTNFVNGSPQDNGVIAGLVAKGALNGVHFHAQDLDALFEKVRAAGAELVSEPADQPWGVRDFAVRDPSGNLVRVNEARPVASQ